MKGELKTMGFKTDIEIAQETDDASDHRDCEESRN